MKPNRYLAPIGVLLFLALCLVPAAPAQQGSPISFASGQPFQVGIEYCVGTAATCPAGVIPISVGTASSGRFTVSGLQSFVVVYQPAGTTSGCTFTLDGVNQLGIVTTGGIVASQSCTSAGSFATSSATQYVQGQLSYSVTTTGSVIFTVFGCTATTGCGASAGSSVTVGNFPSSQNVVCTSGCSGTNASVGTSGTAVPASSTLMAGKNGSGNLQPIATDASGNAAVNVQNFPSTQAVSIATLPALAAGANAIGTVGVTSTVAIPTGTNAIGSVNPTLSSGAFVAGQQAVTGTAAALPSTVLTRPACIVAPATNSLTVYLGPSGETTSTGFPLPPGASLCGLPVSNLNQVFVIASTTGSSVAWSAQ